MLAIGFAILQHTIICHDERTSFLSQAVGKDIKGKLSNGLYLIAIIISFFNQWIAAGIYFLVALMWLIPNSRIEKKFDKEERN